EEDDELIWNEERGRVERLERIRYGSLVLDESRRVPPPSAEVSAILAREAFRAFEKLVDPEAWREALARLALAREVIPGIPELDEATLREALGRLAEGATGLEELRALDLQETLLAELLGEQRAHLERMLPLRVGLPGGRQVKVHYEEGRPPWIESRIQDFFGM